MKLKTLAVGLCTIALLAGCGAKGDDAKSEKEDKTIRIGASVTPHAEILKHVKPALEKKGYIRHWSMMSWMRISSSISRIWSTGQKRLMSQTNSQACLRYTLSRWASIPTIIHH